MAKDKNDTLTKLQIVDHVLTQTMYIKDLNAAI